MTAQESDTHPPQPWQFETLEMDGATAKALDSFRDDLWKYEIPRLPGTHNPHSREVVRYSDGSNVDINIREGGVDAAVRRVTAAFSPEATATAWSVLAHREAELPELLSGGIGVHIRVGYEGGWMQYALTPASVGAETHPTAGLKQYDDEQSLSIVSMNDHAKWLSMDLNPKLVEVLDENLLEPDKLMAFTVSMAARSLHQARVARVNGAISTGKFTVDYPAPLE